MKRILILFSLLLLSALAVGQTATVTGTFQDPTSQIFANGTVTVTFVPTPGVPGPFTVNGSPIQLNGVNYGGAQTFNLDGTGSMSITMSRNDFIQPAKSQWMFVVCPNAQAACTVATTSVLGASVSLSSLVNAAIQPLQVVAGSGIPRAYNNAELILTPNAGQVYWNTISNTLNFWNGSTWLTALVTGSSPTFSTLTVTGLSTFSGAVNITGASTFSNVANVGNVVYCDAQIGADIGAKCNAAYTAGNCATQYCTIRISSFGPNNYSLVLTLGTITIPAWTYSTTMSFATPVDLECDPGVWLNYIGSGKAAKFGPDGLTISTRDPRPYKTSGCVWTGGGSQTAGLYFNTFTVKDIIEDTWFINDGNSSAYNVFFQSQNWDVTLNNIYMWNENNVCYNGVNLNGFATDNTTFDNAQSFLFGYHVHIQTNVPSACNTTGMLINGSNSKLEGSSISGFNPNLRLRGKGGYMFHLSGNSHMEVTSTTPGACSIVYGDLSSDPSAGTSFYLASLAITDSVIVVHNTDFSTTAHAICPATASTGLIDTYLNHLQVWAITSGQPIVVQNNNTTQTGNRAFNTMYNTTNSEPGTSLFGIATGPSGNLHTIASNINNWDGTDGDLYSVYGNGILIPNGTQNGGTLQGYQAKDSTGTPRTLIGATSATNSITQLVAATNSGGIQLANQNQSVGWFICNTTLNQCQSLLVFNATTGLQVNSSTTITQITKYTQTITAASVGAASSSEQSFTLTGVATNDNCTMNPVASGNAAVPVNIRITSANTIAIDYINPTAGALTPTPGTYTFTCIRG